MRDRVSLNFKFVHFNAPVTMSAHKAFHYDAYGPVALKHLEFIIIIQTTKYLEK